MFNEWINKHKYAPKKKKETQKPKYKPIRKAYGLAYSLNKKKQPSIKIALDDFSESDDSESNVIQETSMEQSEDEEERPLVAGEYKIEKNKMFEELSCIQPNAQNPVQLPDESASSSENSELSN